MDRSELIKYWLESSDRDFITMEHLFEKKDFHWSLFKYDKDLKKWIAVNSVMNSTWGNIIKKTF